MKKELIKAVLEDDEETFMKILDKHDLSVINFQDSAGFTALHYAVQNNKYAFVEKLLNAGADFELQDKYGNTALIRAVSSFRGDGRIIELLLANGADRNKKNNYGFLQLSMQEMLQTMILLNSSIEAVGDGQLFLRQKIYNEGVA